MPSRIPFRVEEVDELHSYLRIIATSTAVFSYNGVKFSYERLERFIDQTHLPRAHPMDGMVEVYLSSDREIPFKEFLTWLVKRTFREEYYEQWMIVMDRFSEKEPVPTDELATLAKEYIEEFLSSIPEQEPLFYYKIALFRYCTFASATIHRKGVWDVFKRSLELLQSEYPLSDEQFERTVESFRKLNDA